MTKFSNIFLFGKSNKSSPITPQAKDEIKSQQQQGSTVTGTEVQASHETLSHATLI